MSRNLAGLLVAAVFAAALHPAAAQQPDSTDVGLARAAAAHPQPGDRLFVHVWHEPLLTDTVMVDERGQVLLPKIGVVTVSTLPIGSVRDTIRHRFSEFLRDAPVDVIVLRRIVVNGAVQKPGVYYVDVTATLRDAIALAEGVAEVGNPGKVEIVRGSRRIAVPNWADENSRASDLRSGDEVVVGRRSWFELNALSIVSVSTVVASLLISLRLHL